MESNHTTVILVSRIGTVLQQKHCNFFLPSTQKINPSLFSCMLGKHYHSIIPICSQMQCCVSLIICTINVWWIFSKKLKKQKIFWFRLNSSVVIISGERKLTMKQYQIFKKLCVSFSSCSKELSLNFFTSFPFCLCVNKMKP